MVVDCHINEDMHAFNGAIVVYGSNLSSGILTNEDVDCFHHYNNVADGELNSND